MHLNISKCCGTLRTKNIPPFSKESKTPNIKFNNQLHDVHTKEATVYSSKIPACEKKEEHVCDKK